MIEFQILQENFSRMHANAANASKKGRSLTMSK